MLLGPLSSITKKGFTATCVLGLNKVQLPLSYITHFCVFRSYCLYISSGMEYPVLSRKLRPSGGLAGRFLSYLSDWEKEEVCMIAEKFVCALLRKAVWCDLHIHM